MVKSVERPILAPWLSLALVALWLLLNGADDPGQLLMALLLLASGVFTLAAGIGGLWFRSFFMSMHPPALAFSLSAWCVTLAAILYFTARQRVLSLHAWLIIVFLSMTVPSAATRLPFTRIRADPSRRR